MFFWLTLLLLFSGCSERTPEALNRTLLQQIAAIADHLNRIETFEELQKELPKLEDQYNDLAETMLHLMDLETVNLSETKESRMASERYEEALHRISQIDGGEALLREAMRPGRERLFLKAL